MIIMRVGEKYVDYAIIQYPIGLLYVPYVFARRMKMMEGIKQMLIEHPLDIPEMNVKGLADIVAGWI